MNFVEVRVNGFIVLLFPPFSFHRRNRRQIQESRVSP